MGTEIASKIYHEHDNPPIRGRNYISENVERSSVAEGNNNFASTDVDLWMQGLAENSEQKDLGLNEIKNLILELAAGGNLTENISIVRKLADWVKACPDENESQDRIVMVEQNIAQVLGEERPVTLQLLILLGELDQQRVLPYVDESLLQTLEMRPGVLPKIAREQIEELNKSTNPVARMASHKILDFFESYLISLQEPPQDEGPWDQVYFQGLSFEISQLAGEMAASSKNFLLKKHWQNVYATEHPNMARKPDEVKGVAGAASDRTIARFNRDIQIESYYNRLALGITDINPDLNSIIAISDQHLGRYVNGRLKAVYTEDKKAIRQVKKIEETLIKKNKKKANDIYSLLNYGPMIAGKMPDDHLMVWQLDTFRQFRASAGETEGFYFRILSDEETERSEYLSPIYERGIDPKNIHPVVLSYILEYNAEVIEKARQGLKPVKTAQPIDSVELLKVQFPNGKVSVEAKYNYEYMMSLAMRKSIEEELGINLANIPEYSQVQLVNYLNGRTPEEYQRVVDAGVALGGRQEGYYYSKTSRDFFISFLACSEDMANSEMILKLAESLPPELAVRIFSKYTEIVDASERVKEYVIERFGQGQMEEMGAQAAIRDIFIKANLLLSHMSKEVDKTRDVERLTEQLDAFRSEVTLYMSVIGELRKERKVSLQEEIEKNTVVKKGGEFTAEEISIMKKIFAFGRAESFPEELQEQSSAEFEQKLTDSSHTFYLFMPEGKIVGFLHTDPVKNPDGTIKNHAVYVGSLNISPEGRSSPIGVVFTQYFLEKYGSNNDIYADVLEANSRALNFYTKFLGFKQREDDPYSEIEGKKGNKFKNINIIREMRPETMAKAA